MIVFDVPVWQVLTLLAGIVLPLLVGLVTTRVTEPGRKAIILAALSVTISLLTEMAAALQRDEAYNLGMALLLGVGTFLIATGTHYGFWKPTGVAAKAADVAHTAPEPAPREQFEQVVNTHGRSEKLRTEQQYLGNADQPEQRPGV